MTNSSCWTSEVVEPVFQTESIFDWIRQIVGAISINGEITFSLAHSSQLFLANQVSSKCFLWPLQLSNWHIFWFQMWRNWYDCYHRLQLNWNLCTVSPFFDNKYKKNKTFVYYPSFIIMSHIMLCFAINVIKVKMGSGGVTPHNGLKLPLGWEKDEMKIWKC